MYRSILAIVLLFGCLYTSSAANKTLNPIQFGLFEAKSGVDRYKVLYKTHCEAQRTNAFVSYKGIKSIELEVPLGANRIPLTEQTDFAGASIYVTNNHANVFLFELSQKSNSLEVSNSQVDNGVFTDIPEIRVGTYLVIIEDSTPWVKRRIGYSYGAVRKDILLVKNGFAVNHVVSPYNNSWSNAKATFCPVSPRRKTISNLKLYRKPGNKKMAFFININNENDVLLSNIEIHTPNDNLVDDSIISISNCTNVKFNRVTINGTYSRNDHSGYGILMDNVWNSYFYKLIAHGNWGVFGDNNINMVKFKKCDINRFDIHCYGKNVYFTDCTFRDFYNQFSSVFGEVVFKRCEFINCFPVAFGASYNAYTKFDLKVKNCTVRENDSHHYFIIMNGFENPVVNDRPELVQKEWPNIYIDGLSIITDDSRKFRLSNLSSNSIDLMEESLPTHVEIKRVKYIKQ